MRGYRMLKDTGKLKVIEDVLTDIAITEIPQKRFPFHTWFFGASADHLNIAIRQYLYIRIITGRFPKAFYRCFSVPYLKLAFPLPKPWQAMISDKYMPVAHFRSTLLWYSFLFLIWGYGVLQCALTIWRILTERSHSMTGSHIHLCHITAHQFPKHIPNGQSYDFISWLIKNEDEKAFEFITHQAADYTEDHAGPLKCFYQPKAISIPEGVIPRIQFTVWLIFAILYSFIALLCGRWASVLFLSEAVQARAARGCQRTQIAETYFLNNSALTFRPLWTYEIVKLGARLEMYFYSTNCEPFKRPWGYPIRPEHHLLNWPSYMVWDEYQAQFIKDLVGEAPNIKICGPVWFGEDAATLPKFNTPTVAVFDVPPVRASFFFTIGLEFEYYHPSTVTKFVSDCEFISQEIDMPFLWKQKRDRGKFNHPTYSNITYTTNQLKNMIMIEPKISAHRVIAEASVVVSAPFTSTAYIAREMGRPSCYYDARGELFPDDKGAHGIPIIQNRDALLSWVQNALKSEKSS